MIDLFYCIFDYFVLNYTQVMNMPDYRELYLKMVRASEQAIRILIAAQQECEELYLNMPEPELIVLDTQNSLTDSEESDIV